MPCLPDPSHEGHRKGRNTTAFFFPTAHTRARAQDNFRLPHSPLPRLTTAFFSTAAHARARAGEENQYRVSAQVGILIGPAPDGAAGDPSTRRVRHETKRPAPPTRRPTGIDSDMTNRAASGCVKGRRARRKMYANRPPETLDNVGASVYGIGMDTHTDPRPPILPPVKAAPRRIPEWVQRAQAGQLVRKDMTGTVAA